MKRNIQSIYRDSEHKVTKTLFNSAISKIAKLTSVLILFALMSIVIGACKNLRNEKPTDTTQEKNTQASNPQGNGRGPQRETDRVFGVVAKTMKKTTIVDTITVGGDIQAKQSVNISPDTSGTLQRLMVTEGQRVSKGTIIAYVDPSKAGQKFKLSPVVSTISGTITTLPTKVGNTVSLSQIIARVADNTDIEVRVNIPEKYVGKIHKNTKGILSVIAYPNERFGLTTGTYSEVLSSNTHTMSLTMNFDKIDRRLKSGMFGNLEVILEEKNEVLVVQRDVLMIRLLNNVSTIGVFVLQDNVKSQNNGSQFVLFTPITLGIEDNNNQVEVTEGLSEGDVVIVQGQDSLSDNSMVRVFSLDDEVLISVDDEIKRLKENPEKASVRRLKPGQ